MYTVCDSLWRYQLSDPERGCRLNRLLMQNVATGCTVMINRPLLELALPIPDAAIMHDWWLALVAAAFGKIGTVHEATVLYRQHGGNDTGARKWDWGALARALFDREELAKQFCRNKNERCRIESQARAFLERSQAKLAAEQREMLEAFVTLPTANFFRKRYYTIKYGFYYTGFARNVVRLMTV